MKKVKFYLQLFVTSVILWYLAATLPLQSVYQAILSTNVKVFALALLLIALSLFLMSVRMNMILKGQSINLDLWTVYRIRLISFYYKLFIPGGTLANIGILFYKFSKEKNNHKTKIISAILYDRILATIGLSLIGLLCILVSRPEIHATLLYILIFAFIGSISLFLIAISNTFSKQAIKVLQNYNHPIPNKFAKSIHTINEYRYLSVMTHLTLLALSLLPHIAGVMAFAAVSYAMNLHVTITDWGWMRSVIIFGTMLPISLAGIGIRDGILIYLLVQFSTAPESAWAMSFLLLAVTVLWPAILGLLFGKH